MLRSFLAFLLTLTSAFAWAQNTKVGDWTIGKTSDEAGYFAAVINDSGGLLGKYCYASAAGCFWIFYSDKTCDEGIKYPVMVNAASGAFTTSLLCQPLNGKARMVFENYETIEGGIKGANHIGLAFPMQDGRFTVSRFNIAKQDVALSMLGTLATLLLDAPKSRSTRDQRL